MNGLLVDTNVLSELARPRPSPAVVAFLNAAPIETLYLSDLVLAEIRFGLETTTDLTRRARIDTWLNSFVRPHFADRILALTENILVRWRIMKEVGQRAGYTSPEPDLLIAATASHHGLTILTRDVEPFERAKVAVLNPWDK